ncbi:MAG: serine hydrolase domain-containing protein [Bacteroidota bacterium]
MKLYQISIFAFIVTTALVSLTSCEKNEVLPASNYSCDLGNIDNSTNHPKAAIYQNILSENRKNGLVGAVLLVKDKDGVWAGADGKADIASDIEMASCNTFLIASISKVFTSAAIYRYIDQGVLTLEDPVSKWLDASIIEKVNNADQAQIKHLLAHTSGIADYYTFQFELDRINKITNNFTKLDVLKYTYGVATTNEVGATYYYSNTNFLLLAMILESASGLSFEQVYQQEVFAPLGLNSAYYSEEQPIPDGCVKGYVDVYGNGQHIESEFLYNDELGIGGDGGIAINAFDLATFFEQMIKGNLISDNAINAMTSWFDLPEEWTSPDDIYGQVENGFGIEKFNTQYGTAVGHTGGIDGFSSIALYFPEEDMTYILLLNSAGNEEGGNSRDKIFNEVMEEMFE